MTRTLTRDLISALADNHGLVHPQVDHLRRRTHERAPPDATRADWCTNLSLLLLLRCLQHAAECRLADCPSCDAVLWRLEDPDLLRASQAAQEMEHLAQVEQHARDFIGALDDHSPARGARASAAARLLRAALGGPIHNTGAHSEGERMGTSRHTTDQRRDVGKASEGLTRLQVKELATEHGVATTTVYKWRKEAHAAERAAAKQLEAGGASVSELQGRMRALEGALADAMIEILSLRRQQQLADL